MEISDQQDEYQMNKNLLNLSVLKEYIEKQGFQTFAELIKIGKGEQSHAQIIADYTKRSECLLTIIPTLAVPATRKTLNGTLASELLVINKVPVLIVPIIF